MVTLTASLGPHDRVNQTKILSERRQTHLLASGINGSRVRNRIQHPAAVLERELGAVDLGPAGLYLQPVDKHGDGSTVDVSALVRLLDMREHVPHEPGIVNRVLDDEEGGIDSLAPDLLRGRPTPFLDVGLEPGSVGRVGPGHERYLGRVKLPANAESFPHGLIGFPPLGELPACLGDNSRRWLVSSGIAAAGEEDKKQKPAR